MKIGGASSPGRPSRAALETVPPATLPQATEPADHQRIVAKRVVCFHQDRQAPVVLAGRDPELATDCRGLGPGALPPRTLEGEDGSVTLRQCHLGEPANPEVQKQAPAAAAAPKSVRPAPAGARPKVAPMLPTAIRAACEPAQPGRPATSVKDRKNERSIVKFLDGLRGGRDNLLVEIEEPTTLAASSGRQGRREPSGPAADR